MVKTGFICDRSGFDADTFVSIVGLILRRFNEHVN